ncbi:hypothetical protein EJ04DRAFT_178468 [Polyplosphaeria fusca]|uniref:Uncharacterized protein n=1 Tax=Polyplosphaeria fusca TaxID=682080 RepID=A0A9P4R373_9PLEO|nr:hypothetical protein EJ04DRAFT_178468 [Polyplosphaeria fusca]
MLGRPRRTTSLSEHHQMTKWLKIGMCIWAHTWSLQWPRCVRPTIWLRRGGAAVQHVPRQAEAPRPGASDVDGWRASADGGGNRSGSGSGVGVVVGRHRALHFRSHHCSVIVARVACEQPATSQRPASDPVHQMQSNNATRRPTDKARFGHLYCRQAPTPRSALQHPVVDRTRRPSNNHVQATMSNHVDEPGERRRMRHLCTFDGFR